MTTEEVIEELEKMYRSDNPVMYGRRGTIKAAIEKLEKQNPKKLFGNKHNPITIGDTVSGMCPVCMEPFVCITPRYYKEKGYGYCRQCGQKLDWSESIEENRNMPDVQ